MNTLKALDLMQCGELLKREGWSEAFVFKSLSVAAPARSVPKLLNLPIPVSSIIARKGKDIIIHSDTLFYDGREIYRWIPTQQDALATDWSIVSKTQLHDK